jgi:hypothetical protein
MRKLSAENVRATLLLADLRDCTELKSACFTFVARNSATVLTRPDVMALATERLDLWTELVATIGGGGKKRKKDDE